jgi:hypothetical protein
MTATTALAERIVLYRVKPKPGRCGEKEFDLYVDGVCIGWARRVDAPMRWSVFLSRPHMSPRSGHGGTFSDAFRAAVMGTINDLDQEADRMRTIAENLDEETIPDPED